MGDRGNRERLAYLRAELDAAWTAPTFDAERAHKALQALRQELKAMGFKHSSHNRSEGQRARRLPAAPVRK